MVILFFIILFVAVPQAARAYDDGDFQYWNTESGTVKINDQWFFTGEEEFRFGDSAGDFYYQHTDLGLKYSGLAKWLDVKFDYRGIFTKANGDWSFENRPHLNLTIKNKLAGFSLSNNARLEFRIRQTAEDKPRYRHKTTLALPWTWTSWKIQPYLAEEAFIDFESTEFTRNRFYSGLVSRITKNLKLDIFYLLESVKASPDWKDTNVLGTKFKFSF